MSEQPKQPPVLTCQRCAIKYSMGMWDFYRLCDSCFTEFDDQKMSGRRSLINGGKGERFESVTRWIKHLNDSKYTEGSDGRMYMDDFFPA